jgi:PAS domain S-box-containing protein
MLTLSALPPETIGSTLCTLLLAAGLLVMAWSGRGVPATGWWAATLLLDGAQALSELAVPGATIAGLQVGTSLQFVEAATAAWGAYRWFGLRLFAVLAVGAVGLAIVMSPSGAAGFAAGAAVHLGIAAWLGGRSRRTLVYLPIAAGFALMGGLDFMAAVDPGFGWRSIWPAVLTPAAAAAIATGLAALAVTGTAAGGRGRALQKVMDEVALRASEQRVRDFAEAASEWFWEMGPDLRFTYVSPRMREVTGIDPAGLIGLGRADVHNDSASASLSAHLEDMERRRPFHDFRYRSKSAYGAARHLSISGKPWFDASGAFMGYRGIGRDVTAEMEARAEAVRKSALLDAAVANMAEGITIIDRDGRFVLANDRVRDLLDFPEELLKPGTPSRGILRLAAQRGDYGAHDGSDEAIEKLVEARLALVLTSQDHILKRPAPRGRIVEVRGRRMPMGELVTTYVDITHLKGAETAILQAKEAAEIANRSKTEFLATVSHELRTPLNAIIGFSEIIRDQVFGPGAAGRYRSYAGDIHESGVHLLNIINDILDVAKVEAGAVELHLEIVDMVETIAQAARLVRERTRAAGLDLAIDLPTDLPRIEADQRRFKQVLLNLLSNAVKFTPHGGRIAVAARRDGTQVTIEVADTGIGMTAAEIKIALEPFRQVASHLTRNVEGTGLGLSLVQSLVTLHHGTLTLDSVPGQGTRAIVCLPLRQPRRTGGHA